MRLRDTETKKIREFTVQNQERDFFRELGATQSGEVLKRYLTRLVDEITDARNLEGEVELEAAKIVAQIIETNIIDHLNYRPPQATPPDKRDRLE